MPSTIQHKTARRHGKPFWLVVKEYADAGYSISETAKALGYSYPYTGFYQAVTRKACRSWFVHGNSAKDSRRTARRMEKHTLDGITDTVAGHCRRLSVNPNTIRSRMRRGQTLEQALSWQTTPKPTGCGPDHPWRRRHLEE